MMQYKKKVINKRYVVALTVAMAFAVGVGVADAATKDITLVKTWNLINTPLEPTNPAIDTVLTGLDYATAWAWDATAGKWKVRLGSESGSAIGTYATSKGFSSLTEIHAGQGFWLNMNAAGTLTITGDAPASTAKTLVKGWNLVGSLVDQASPVSGVLSSLTGAGINAVSLWKWDGGKWAVRLPSEADGGQAYATAKGFSLLASVAATDGYWVNSSVGGSIYDLPPAVGKVYKTTGANSYVPLANAPVFLNGTQIGTTDANGNFPLPANLTATDVITVGEGGEYTVSGSNLTGNAMYLFAQDTDNNKVTLSPADVSASKPSPKEVCSSSKRACLTISKMTLTEDITLTVTEYKDPLTLPNVAQIKDLDPQYKVVAGGDVTFVNSKNQKIDDAGFGGTVLAKASNFLTDLDGSTIDEYTNPTDKDGNLDPQAPKVGSLDVLEYNAQSGTWSKVGAATIVGVAKKIKNPNDTTPEDPTDNLIDETDENGKVVKAYTLKSSPNSLSGLNPFAFAFKTDFLKGSVDVTVSNDGLLFKKAGEADVVVQTDTEGKGVVKEESYGDKVANALVTTDNSDIFVTTNADGTATIEYILPPDNPNISLLIKKDGYFDATATVNVVEDTAKAVGMMEVPNTAAVGGIISDSETSLGIPGAQVTLKNPIVLDKVADDGETIQVGLDGNATYKWEIKKQVESPLTSDWYTIAEGLGKDGKNTITKTDIKLALIDGYNSLSAEAKAAIGADPAGTYDMKITVTHPESNGNYVETATGYLDITFDLTKMQQTPSLSQGQQPPEEPTLWGGAEKGYYMATMPYGFSDATIYWQVFITSWDDVNQNLEYDTDEITILAQTPALDTPFVMFTQPLNLIQQNYWKLLQPGNFQEPGVNPTDTYLQQGVELRMEFSASYTFVGTVYDFTGPNAMHSWFDIQADNYLDPLAVGKLQMLPNTTMVFEDNQLTDENGAYLFPFLDPQLNGLLELSAAADTYLPNSLFLYEDQGYGLIEGWITTANLALTPVETPPPTIEMPPTPGVPETVTGWLETFENGVPDTENAALFTTDANNGAWTIAVDETGTPVQWWALTNPESVGPAQGAIQYPLADTTDGTAQSSTEGAYLLPAYEGTGVAWFGSTTTGTFSNVAGNYSNGSKSGTLTSPTIDLANYSFVTLDFASWFEVESVDVAKWQYDQMKVEVCVLADTSVTIADTVFSGTCDQPADWKILTFMNPDAEAAVQQADINFSSGGNNAVPVWVKKQANLDPFAGKTIKLRFNFQSQDSLYNGGRGWAVDNIAILNNASDIPFSIQQSGYWWKAPTRKP